MKKSYYNYKENNDMQKSGKKKRIFSGRWNIKAAVIMAVTLSALLGQPAEVFAEEAAGAETAADTAAGTGAQEVEPDGQAVLPGWLYENDHWYYLDENGIQAAGWEKINGKYYYFRADHTMATGSMKEGETFYTFTPDLGSIANARKEKNSGGGSFTVGFYEKERQELADNLNELKEDVFDGDEDDDYYDDEKVDYDKDASFIISGRLTEIAEHRLSMARDKGYGNGEIPDEGTLETYVKSIRYNSGRRFMEVYLKSCIDADDAENKLIRSHGNSEKKSRDRASYYNEMGIAHETVDGKNYYMVIFMR